MYETKVILQMLANQVVFAESTKQVYEMIRLAAQVEGMTMPDFEKLKEQIEKGKQET